MTRTKTSTTKAKKYFRKDIENTSDVFAASISKEFIDPQPEGEYSGGTIEVHSETNLQSDPGQGDNFILRAFKFTTNPEYLNGSRPMPSFQEIFDSHIKGIAGQLWGDGFTPVLEIDPRIVFSGDKTSYLVMVWARPSMGQTVIEKPLTLGEIANQNYVSRKNTNSV